MMHDTVSSVAVTSRRMAFRCFVPGMAAPIIPILWNVPAPSSVLNAHPMECSSIILCSDLVIHVVADELSPAAWSAAGHLCSLTECSK